MDRAKLTVRVPRLLLERAKRYAEAHDATLTRSVTEYLRRLGTHDDNLADAPVVRRLSGVVPGALGRRSTARTCGAGTLMAPELAALIDLNAIMDVLLRREPLYAPSALVLAAEAPVRRSRGGGDAGRRS